MDDDVATGDVAVDGGRTVVTDVRAAVRQSRRLEVLVDLGLVGLDAAGQEQEPGSGLDPTARGALDDLASLAAALTGCETAAVSVPLAGRVLFAGLHGGWDRLLPLVEEQVMCARVVAGRGPYEVPDATLDLEWEDHPFVRAGALRSYVGQPVVVDGEVLGSLCVFGPAPYQATDEVRRRLAVVGRHASEYLALLRRFRVLEAERARFRAQQDAVEQLCAGGPVADVLDLLLAHAVGASGLAAVAVRVVDGRLVTAAHRGLPPDYVAALHGAPAAESAGPVGAAAARGAPVEGPDTSSGGVAGLAGRDGGPAAQADPLRAAGFVRCRAVPVLAAGEVVGVVAVHAAVAADLDEHAVRRLDAAAGLAVLALGRTGAGAADGPVRDALTGLLSRGGFLAAAAEAVRGLDGPHAVLVVDLDRLRIVNASLGHAAGDEYVRVTGARLREVFGGRQVLGRIGGDEFAVLCPGTDAAAAAELAAAFAVRLASPVRLAGEPVAVSASVGVAAAGDGRAADVAVLLRDAEQALRAAKRSGRGQVVVSDPGLLGAAEEASGVELALRRLLAGDVGPGAELSLVYQPQVDLVRGRVCGLEALLRWDRPEGPVPPSVLLPVAEEAGLMPELGAFVLRTAVEQHVRWRAEGSPWGDAVMWVNVSGHQLEEVGFAARVGALLEAAHVPPERIGLEITESVVTGRTLTARGELRALRDLGVRLAIDDFGTGFSNLALLRSAPVDVVKVDKSLVAGVGADPDGARLVDAVLGLAAAFDLEVVAEGVETEDQLQALAGRSCHVVQGYLLALPSAAALPADPAEVAVRARSLHGPSQAAPARPLVDPVAGFDGFETAARAVLAQLRSEIGMRLWTVTRAAGQHQVVLVSDHSEAYDVEPGASLPWQGSLCVRMVEGRAPRVAPDVEAVPAYAQAPNRELVPIRAYIGVPLLDHGGELFGTLCAFDLDPQPGALVDVAPRVELFARLLSTVLAGELAGEEQRRRVERAEAEAARDPLTGLANRRGWTDVLAREEARCRRYGHPATVVVLDLDDLKRVNDRAGHAAGDRLLRVAADILRTHVRAGDLVARLGGDEFGVLAMQADATGAGAGCERLVRALAEAGVAASAGLAQRSPHGTLALAWEEADAQMYRTKRARRHGSG